jgi:hypothetical protein
MRFLQQVVVPLLVVGTAARSHLRIRDGEALGGLNSTDSVGVTENVDNIDNADNLDNVDNVDNVDSADAVEGADAGPVRTIFYDIWRAVLTFL